MYVVNDVGRQQFLVAARITGIGAGDVVHLILIDYASIPPSVI